MAEIKLTEVPGIGPATARILTEHGLPTVSAVAITTTAALMKVPGFGSVRAAETIRAAQSVRVEGDITEVKEPDKKKKKKKKKKDKKGKGKKKKKDKKGKKKKGKKKRQK